MREILLKARQEGFSTAIAALFFVDTLNNPYTRSIVIAHDTETTLKLFAMAQIFYDNLTPDKRPQAKNQTRREFVFEELGSSYYVGTAGSKQIGRGTTPNNVHGSEVAFWADAGMIMSGLMQGVPRSGNIILETTANGLGGYYHSEYELAQLGESVFTPRFYAWFELPEYRETVPEGFKRTDAEKKLAKVHGLDDEQLCFLRLKDKELREKRPQEYPNDAEEAFLSSGNPYFSRTVLRDMRASCVDPLHPSEFEEEIEHWHRLRAAIEDPGTVDQRFGPRLSVFEAPRANRRYVVAADPSEGINDDGIHDFCAAHVFDIKTWQQVAVLHGKWDTHEFGLLLGELGRWYNTALIGVERNNHGHAVLNALIHADNYPLMGSDLPWGGVYTHEEFDEDKKEKQKKPGWPTTVKTKFFALDTLGTALYEGDIRIADLRTVDQLLKFIKKPGGKAGGEKGAHDDLVIACSIAAALIVTVKPSASGWGGVMLV